MLNPSYPENPPPESTASRPNWLIKIALALLTMSPIIYALLTWDPQSRGVYVQDVFRFFSFPIVAIQIIVVIIALKAGFSLKKAISSMGWRALPLAIIIAIGGCNSAFVAVDKQYAIILLCVTVFHILFALSIFYLFRRALRLRVIKKFWNLVALGCLGFLIVLTAFVSAIENPLNFDWVRFSLAVINVRQLGFYSTVGIGAALGVAALSRTKLSYWSYVGIASLMFALTFWSGTRSTIVAIGFAYLMGLYFMPIARKARVLGALLVSLLLGGALSLIHRPHDASYGLWRILSSAGAGDSDAISSGRLTMWKGTLAVIAERPWFGFGEGQFRQIVPEAYGVFNHPHNAVLQIALQWGVIGLVCFCGVVAPLWYRAMQLCRDNVGGQLFSAFLVLNALCVFSLYEGALFHPYPVMMIIVGAAFILARGPCPRAEKIPARQTRRTYFSLRTAA